MQHYDVFFSYEESDKVVVEKIADNLKARGITVGNEFNESLGRFSGALVSQINPEEAINLSDYFIIIAGKALSEATSAARTQRFQMNKAAIRRKKVIYVDLTADEVMSLGTISPKDVVLRIFVNADIESGILTASAKIAKFIQQAESKKELYEKLSAFTKMGIADKEAELVCILIDSICERIEDEQDDKKRKEQFEELGRCLKKLYGKKEVLNEATCQKVVSSLAKAKHLVDEEVAKEKSKSNESKSLGKTALAGAAIAGAMLGGAALGNAVLPGAGMVFGATLGGMLYNKNLTKKSTKSSGSPSENGEQQNNSSTSENSAKAAGSNNELFHRVANFMNEGNKILDLIGENENAEEFFRCLLVSYQRLKKYCEIVKDVEIYEECSGRISELKNKLKNFSGESSSANGIAENSIKTLLGFEAVKTEKYDVFISHKNEDSDIAEGLYDYLKGNSIEPFFDKKTLTELAESEYRKAIMKALDNSTHFVVLLSNLEYMNSKWVEKEMETFMNEKTEGRKDGNFIILVTDDVFDEITKSNKSNIPIEYRGFEIMKLGEYEERILGYLSK